MDRRERITRFFAPQQKEIEIGPDFEPLAPKPWATISALTPYSQGEPVYRARRFFVAPLGCREAITFGTAVTKPAQLANAEPVT
jgi:hypothetical protein